MLLSFSFRSSPRRLHAQHHRPDPTPSPARAIHIEIGQVRPPPISHRLLHKGHADKRLVRLAAELGFNGVQIQIEGSTVDGLIAFKAYDAKSISSITAIPRHEGHHLGPRTQRCPASTCPNPSAHTPTTPSSGPSSTPAMNGSSTMSSPMSMPVPHRRRNRNPRHRCPVMLKLIDCSAALRPSRQIAPVALSSGTREFTGSWMPSNSSPDTVIMSKCVPRTGTPRINGLEIGDVAAVPRSRV